MLSIISNMFLPPEIWDHIFSFVPFKWLLPMKRVSRAWNGIINNYFRHKNIPLDIRGYVIDSYYRKEYHFLVHFLDNKQYDRFRQAILIASKIGDIKPYLFARPKCNGTTKDDFDDSWGNTEIINQIYLKAVYYNQTVFLDNFVNRWNHWRFPVPAKPYSYETAVWLHQHGSPQYPKLLSYFIEQHNPKADDLIKNDIINKNNDYYFALGKQGVVVDEINVWYLYGLADGGHLELVKEIIGIYRSFDADTYRVCFYKKGITLLNHFLGKINLDFLIEAFNNKRLDICDLIIEQHIDKISFKHYKWEHLQFISYILSKTALRDEIKKRTCSCLYFDDYVIFKAGINDLNLLFESDIIGPDTLIKKLHHIARRSLEIFLFVYNKLTDVYKCKILLRKKLYHAYEAIHPKYDCNRDCCQETVLPKIIKFIPRLIPYFIKTKSIIKKNGESFKIYHKVFPYHPSFAELDCCKLKDIKKLILLGYRQTDPYQYYQNNAEMSTWLKANRIPMQQ